MVDLSLSHFRRDQIPLARNIRWGQYIDPDTSDQALKNVVRQILEGRIRLQWTDIHNTHRLPRTRLVKEIRATNLLPWVVREFLDMPVVYLLRHPLAASWSAAELGWKSRLSEFLVQVPLIEGPLRRYKQVIATYSEDDDLFLRHVLRWCLENVVPIDSLAPDALHVIFYEELVANPRGELERLRQRIAKFEHPWWSFETTELSALGRASKTNTRGTAVASDVQQLSRSLSVIPQAKAGRALELIEKFGLDRLYGPEALPRISADTVLEVGSGRPERPRLASTRD